MADEDVPTARRQCTAPWTALYFDPTGNVMPCCVSHNYAIGRIGLPDRPSLLDMWQGARADLLRQAIAADDFTLGCDECDPDRVPISDAPAREFDRYSAPASHVYPRMMDFALSNTCNLQCIMCNGDLSSSIRVQREHRAPLVSPYDDRFFDELREFLPYLERCLFKGGEPFLGREPRRVWDLLLEMNCTPEVVTVTNGTVWNETVEHYARALAMNVNVSIDGVTDDTMRAIRVGASHGEVATNIVRFRDLCEEVGTSITLNFCLQRANWHELPRLVAWAEELRAGVNIIDVAYPSRFSLMALPPDRLEVIASTLEQEAATLALGSLGRVLDHTITMVRSASLARPTEQAVAVRVRPDLASELARWSDREVLVVRTEDDAVIAVDAPGWAEAWFAPERWIGGLVTEIPGHLERQLAGRASVHRNHREDGADDFDLEVASAGGVTTFRLMVESDGTGTTAPTETRVLLGYRGALPEAATQLNPRG